MSHELALVILDSMTVLTFLVIVGFIFACFPHRKSAFAGF